MTGWERSDAGLDRDPWLRRFRRSSRAYGNPEDALAFYSRIFLEAPMGMVILTKNHLVADANVAAQKLLKRSLEKLRGSPFLRTVAKIDRSAFIDMSQDLITTAHRKSRPLRLVDAQGSETEIAIMGASLRDEAGNVEFVMLVFLEAGENVTADIL